MKPAPGVTFAELDSTEVVDDGLVVMAWLSNGTLLGVVVPVDELIRRGHAFVEGTHA